MMPITKDSQLHLCDYCGKMADPSIITYSVYDLKKKHYFCSEVCYNNFWRANKV